MEVSSRERFLHELQTFIAEHKRKANSILQTLEWSPERTFQEKLHQKDKNAENVQSIVTKHAIALDPHIIRELVGNVIDCDTLDEISMSQLNAQQKLALYEYCIEKTGRLSEPEITIKFDPEEDGQKREMTFAEIVTQKRNLKRRTTRYRTGASQSHVAELRNLIEIQMGALRQYIDDNCNKSTEKKREESKSSRKSEGHRESDHEKRKSSHKQKKYKHKRYRSRER